ncbi:MAG: hypothetical protein GY702_29530 [Desulfobulbaceae bacterium]|nr:hypothetical protein [Desulfobulbaceae bacterium]
MAQVLMVMQVRDGIVFKCFEFDIYYVVFSCITDVFLCSIPIFHLFLLVKCNSSACRDKLNSCMLEISTLGNFFQTVATICKKDFYMQIKQLIGIEIQQVPLEQLD